MTRVLPYLISGGQFYSGCYNPNAGTLLFNISMSTRSSTQWCARMKTAPSCVSAETPGTVGLRRVTVSVRQCAAWPNPGCMCEARSTHCSVTDLVSLVEWPTSLCEAVRLPCPGRRHSEGGCGQSCLCLYHQYPLFPLIYSDNLLLSSERLEMLLMQLPPNFCIQFCECLHKDLDAHLHGHTSRFAYQSDRECLGTALLLLRNLAENAAKIKTLYNMYPLA